jgi:hypothetical protein
VINTPATQVVRVLAARVAKGVMIFERTRVNLNNFMSGKKLEMNQTTRTK